MADFLKNDKLHDIRSKLDVIKGRIDLLRTQEVSENIEIALTSVLDALETALKPNTIKGPAARIQAVSAQVNRLIDEFGKIRKVTEKTIALTYTNGSLEEVDLHQVIDEIFNEIKDVWKSERILFTIKTQSRIKVEIKRAHLESILMNLLYNARKAIQTTATRKILVEAHRDESGCHLVVSDTGCGIPKEAIDKIWAEGVSNTGSTGIGLSSIGKYKRLYDLSVNLESKEGQGTRVEVIFPHGS